MNRQTKNIKMELLPLLLLIALARSTTACSGYPCLCSGIGKAKTAECDMSGLPNDAIIPGIVPRDTRHLTLRNANFLELDQKLLSQFLWITSFECLKCKVTSIYKEAFVYNAHLTNITFHNGNLTTIQSKTFENIKIDTLNLESNRIKDVEFLTSTKIRRLYLSDNPIGDIDFSLYPSLSQVEELYLRNIDLNHVEPDMLAPLSKVHLFDISSNYLTSIGAGTFDYMTNLMQVDMSENHIQTVDKLTWNKHLIIHIDFSHNNISNIDFLENVHVERLYLGGNPIGKIDFIRFPNIRYARTIDLSETGLTAITRDNLLPLIDIQHLSLAGNDIFALEPNIFDHMENLIALDISDNKLTSLDKTMLPSLERLDQCLLIGNPLHCNCELRWLKKSFDDALAGGKNVSASCKTPFSTDMSSMSLSRMTCRKPVVTKLSGDVEIYKREPFTILCTAEGDPQPSVFLQHPTGSTSQETPKPQNKSFYIYSNQIIHKINRASWSDSGRYECVAKNIEGSSTIESIVISVQKGQRHQTSDRREAVVVAAGTLAGAIVGTFFGTILLCVLILFLLYKFVYPRLKKRYPPKRIVSAPRDPDKRTSTLSANFHKPMLPEPLDDFEDPETTYINEPSKDQPPPLPTDRTGVKSFNSDPYSKIGVEEIEIKVRDPKNEDSIYEDLPDGAVYTSPKKIKGLHY